MKRRDYSASHLQHNYKCYCYIDISTQIITWDFRTSKSHHPPQYNSSYYCQIFLVFMDTAGFMFHLILFHYRGTATMLQCHLVMGLSGIYFYKLPKSKLAGKFQMCFHEKAVRSRWCIKPLPNQRKRAFFMEGTLDLPAYPTIVKFQHTP